MQIGSHEEEIPRLAALARNDRVGIENKRRASNYNEGPHSEPPAGVKLMPSIFTVFIGVLNEKVVPVWILLFDEPNLLFTAPFFDLLFPCNGI